MRLKFFMFLALLFSLTSISAADENLGTDNQTIKEKGKKDGIATKEKVNELTEKLKSSYKNSKFGKYLDGYLEGLNEEKTNED